MKAALWIVATIVVLAIVVVALTMFGVLVGGEPTLGAI